MRRFPAGCTRVFAQHGVGAGVRLFSVKMKNEAYKPNTDTGKKRVIITYSETLALLRETAHSRVILSPFCRYGYWCRHRCRCGCRCRRG